MRFTDKATIGAVKKTQEGYVSAVARAVRSGVQDYAGFELGFADRDRIRVYRPDNEVFSKDSLRTFSHAPVTIGHPAEMVDADNWGEFAVGEVGEEILRDGEFIAVSLMLKDKKAVDAYEAGTVELSAGYTAEIEFVDGQADYDAVMKNIRINHLALVDKARAGSKARIGDADQWGAAPLTTSKEVSGMDMKAVAIGDKAFNVKAEDADALKEFVDGLKAEIATLKVESADAAKMVAKLDEMVADGIATIEKAKALVADYDPAGKSTIEIKRDVIAKVYGSDAIADLKSDVEINAAFKVAKSTANDAVRKAVGDAQKQCDDPWADYNAKKGKK